MPKTVAAWFTTSSFSSAVGHWGSEGSGSLIGPGYENWDLAAIKNTKLAERFSLQLRGEFFNAFNHESFSNVDNALADSTFGQITGGHSPRRIQLGAKVVF
jgi:hypothetical protein